MRRGTRSVSFVLRETGRTREKDCGPGTLGTRKGTRGRTSKGGLPDKVGRTEGRTSDWSQFREEGRTAVRCPRHSPESFFGGRGSVPVVLESHWYQSGRE